MRFRRRMFKITWKANIKNEDILGLQKAGLQHQLLNNIKNMGIWNSLVMV